MGDREEASRLIKAARTDLKALSGMDDSAVFVEEIFGFHAQQAVEKSLKAWLCLLGQEYPKTHDLSLLLVRLRDFGEQVEDFDNLVELNSYAVQFRYEAFDELGEPLDRSDVRRRISTLIERVEYAIEN